MGTKESTLETKTTFAHFFKVWTGGAEISIVGRNKRWGVGDAACQRELDVSWFGSEICLNVVCEPTSRRTSTRCE